jgi:hypothetical protein
VRQRSHEVGTKEIGGIEGGRLRGRGAGSGTGSGIMGTGGVAASLG